MHQYTIDSSTGQVKGFGKSAAEQGELVANAGRPIVDLDPSHYQITDPQAPTLVLKTEQEIAAIDAAAATARDRAALHAALDDIAEEKRLAIAAAYRLERWQAHEAKALDIVLRALKGSFQASSYNPVATGAITKSERDYMDAVQARAAAIGQASDAQDSIGSDIDSGTVTDPSELATDPRWPSP